MSVIHLAKSKNSQTIIHRQSTCQHVHKTGDTFQKPSDACCTGENGRLGTCLAPSIFFTLKEQREKRMTYPIVSVNKCQHKAIIIVLAHYKLYIKIQYTNRFIFPGTRIYTLPTTQLNFTTKTLNESFRLRLLYSIVDVLLVIKAFDDLSGQ